ncbi:hypothetical protein NHX12_021896 [Muraenolepis orangiensis]|uniref:Pyrroline-5-carboxylate reductase catalytic N-terminal domain-containing protein n=1 Tax=Muraenolepis orangiensis TaxID=630683 RepID=A0A9Q0EUJ8_9TELE|nr:hypothetical protein NHX12_021896 [Muraenolepis orangiensis]
MDSISMMAGGGSPVFTTSASASSAATTSSHLHPPLPFLSSSSSSNGLRSGSRGDAPRQPRSRSASPPRPPSPPPPHLADDSARPTVAVLGSGDFSKCLTTRLLRGGFHVVVGSRQPQRAAHLFPHVVDVTHHQDAVTKAPLIFLAIRREHYPVLWDLKHLLEGKILVDVSNNRRVNQYPESNAEYLASLLPRSVVVKGFNVISAWAMQQSCPRTPAHSNSLEARQRVMELARRLHFQPVDMGALSSSRDIEDIPVRLFPAWRGPVLSSVALAIFFFAYSFARDIVHPYAKRGQSDFYKIPVETVNRTLPAVSVTLLALVYLAGQLAAAHQLYHATNLCLPMRRSERYLLLNMVHANVENSWNEEEVWRVEMYVSFGIMSLGLLALLAVTSIPSVNSALNWREFSFIQSTLGYIALLIATVHGLLFGWKRAFEEDAYRFYLPPIFVVALALPVCVILGKMLLLLPCVARKLHRIRRGRENDPGSPRTLWAPHRLRHSAGSSAVHVSPERVTIM